MTRPTSLPPLFRQFRWLLTLLPLVLGLPSPARAQSTCGVTDRVSESAAGDEANGASTFASVSADGRYVAFVSSATNLLSEPVSGWPNVYVRDRETGAVERVGTGGSAPRISADGRFVVFLSSSRLTPDPPSWYKKVYLYDRLLAEMELVSVTSTGEPLSFTADNPRISAGGRYVVFQSYASDVVPGDTNGARDVFVRDRVAGTTTRVSLLPDGSQSNQSAGKPDISGDGQTIVFIMGSDAYLYDAITDTVEWLADSADCGSCVTDYHPAIDGDGTVVAYETTAPPVGGAGWRKDVHVLNLTTGLTTSVSHNEAASLPYTTSSWPSLSADGRYVTFSSTDKNLAPDDTNAATSDVFIYDLDTHTRAMLSRSAAGAAGDAASLRSALSADGALAVFDSTATTFVEDLNGGSDVFAANNCLFEPSPCGLTLITPNDGLPRVQGHPVRILWSGAAADGTGPVRLELLRDGAPVRTIADNLPNDGVFEWVVPVDVTPGGGYTIRVSDAAVPDVCSDASNVPFTIEAARCTLQVVEPVGNRVWAIGNGVYPWLSRAIVAWSGETFSLADVRVELLRAGAVVATIAEAIPLSQRRLVWEIPSTLESGSDYAVRVTAVNDPSCVAESTGTLTINRVPSITLDVSPTRTAAGTPITFTATASDPEGSINHYSWYTENDHWGVTTNEPTYTYSYEQTGVYSTYAVVTDTSGLFGSSNVVDVEILPTIAAQAAPPIAPVGWPVRFTATPPLAEWPSSILTYGWDFGDGATDDTSGAVATHAYIAPGIYTVTLQGTDINTMTNTVTVEVDVRTESTTAMALSATPAAPFMREPVQFDVAVTPAEAALTAYLWDFGDGATATTPSPSAEHTYALPGTYAVTVASLDADGAAAAATLDLPVANRPPILSLQANPAVTEPGEPTIAFVATVTDAEGQAWITGWDFGDGSTIEAGGTSQTHQYQFAGTYAVSVTARDEHGGTAETSTDVTITPRDVCIAQEIVSVASDGAQGNGYSGAYDIGSSTVWQGAASADGRFVAFTSWADNLVPGDTNGGADIFVRDRLHGLTERVSVSSLGEEADSWCTEPAISADGRYVAFVSSATNLAPGHRGGVNVYVHDRELGLTERVSATSFGRATGGVCERPKLSADGRYVVFLANAGDLVPGVSSGSKQVYLHDRRMGETSLVSRSPETAQPANAYAWYPAISADGRFISFASTATNLVTTDVNPDADIFVFDRTNGTLEIASVDAGGFQPAEGASFLSQMSANGRYVAFLSRANALLPGGTGQGPYANAYVRDRISSTTEQINLSSAGEAQTSGNVRYLTISGDGRFVAFTAEGATLAGGIAGGHYLYVRDRVAGETRAVSVNPSGSTGNIGLDIAVSTITQDGRHVFYSADVDTLLPADTNGLVDLLRSDNCLADGATSDCSLGVITAAEPTAWAPGETVTLFWFGSAPSGAVRLALTHNGSIMHTITDGAADTGYYTWTVPNDLPQQADYRLRVEDAATGDCFAESRAALAITPPSCTLAVAQPAGGEEWAWGDTVHVEWIGHARDGGRVSLELWRADQPAYAIGEVPDAGAWTWQVPFDVPYATDYRLRVIDAANDSCWAESAGPVQIGCSLQVTYPDGGERLPLDAPLTITWEGAPAGGDTVRIDLLRQGRVDRTITEGAPSTGAYEWTIPADLLPSEYYRIRVVDVAAPTTCFSTSEGDFQLGCTLSIAYPHPRSGAEWGDTLSIQWRGRGFMSDHLNIDLLKYGTLLQSIATAVPTDVGAYDWPVPLDLPEGTAYEVRLSDSIASTTCAQSVEDLWLGCPIHVITPRAENAYTHGSEMVISWMLGPSTLSNVRVSLWRAGAEIQAISESALSYRSVQWIVPEDLEPAEDYVVRVEPGGTFTCYSESAPFSILTTFPPEVAPTGPWQVRPGNEARMSANGSDPDGTIVSYEWDFGDGSPVLTTAEDLVGHVYDAPGVYTATVTATDNKGATANGSVAINVLWGTSDLSWLSPPPAMLAGGEPFTVRWRFNKSEPFAGEHRVHWGIKTVLGSSALLGTNIGDYELTLSAPNVSAVQAPVTYRYLIRALVNGVEHLSAVASTAVHAGPNPPKVEWITPPPASVASGGQFTVEWKLTNFVAPVVTNGVAWGVTTLVGSTADQPGGNGTYSAVVQAPVVQGPGTLYYTAVASNAIEFTYAPLTPVQLSVP